MFKSKLLLLCIVVILVISIKSTRALVQSEYESLISLLNKIEQNTTTYNELNICDFQACQKEEPDCINYFLCDDDNDRITDLNIKGEGNISLSANDFNFPLLKFLSIDSFNVETDFLYLLNTKAPLINTLQCSYCNISSIRIGTSYNTLYLNHSNFQGSLNLSSIINITNLYLYDDVVWVNDIVPSDIINTYYMKFKTSIFPDLTYFNSLESISIYPTSNEIDFSNLNKAPHIMDFEFKRDKKESLSIRLPQSLVNYKPSMELKSSFWKFHSENINWILDEPIDFSKTYIKLFESRDGTIKLNNQESKFPFSKGTLISTLKINNANFNEIDFNVLVNTQSSNFQNNNISMQVGNITLTDYQIDINIDQNKIYGPVPNWFCNLDISFANNQFQGDLPSCYTCFLNNALIRDKVKGNSFSNYNDDMTPSQYPPCKTLVIHYYLLAHVNPNSTLYSLDTLYVFYVFGHDLGINSNIKIAQDDGFGLFSIKMLKPNEIYFVELNEYNYKKLKNISNTFHDKGPLTITFVDPGITIMMNVSNVLDGEILEWNSTLLDPFMYDHENPSTKMPIETSTPSPTNTPPPQQGTSTSPASYEYSNETIDLGPKLSLAPLFSPSLISIISLSLVILILL
ncbi:hypothetical protein CYY_004243 [Polysphondylium violaceum]|uniref:Uncharacterized protein n=1 Tax=Polysphondylium violaceum TaxID=133409 RepID=A0A8J4UT57_9MYCE|nr:hypothetical protein CYY_004243 [Polysphondylium violaceum]